MVGADALFPLILFAVIVAGVWAFMAMISRGNTRAEERLEKYMGSGASSPDMDLEQKRGDRFGGLMDKVAGFADPLKPKKAAEQEKLKLRLANAGYRSEKAPSVFLGIKFLSIIGMAAVAALYYLPQADVTLGKWSGMTAKLMYIGFAAGLGMWIPEFVLSYLVSKRKEAIFLTLPDALDLLVVCVESGLGLDQAMRKVADEMKEHAPVIAEELSIVNYHLQLGRPKREVLHELGQRTGVDDVKSLVAILIQADRFGSSVAQALRVQSDSMRIRRRQLAEEQAAKCAVKLIFPLVLFIFPGIFVVLVGPAYIQIQDKLFK